MKGRVRVLTASLETPREALGAYAPASKSVAHSLHALVARAANEIGPNIFTAASEESAELDLRTTFVKLEPDSPERPFATAQIVVEVARRSTGQVLYTRKAEAETRRLLVAPTPLDDPRFDRTALGRAIQSCLRGVFSGLVETLVTAV